MLTITLLSCSLSTRSSLCMKRLAYPYKKFQNISFQMKFSDVEISTICREFSSSVISEVDMISYRQLYPWGSKIHTRITWNHSWESKHERSLHGRRRTINNSTQHILQVFFQADRHARVKNGVRITFVSWYLKTKLRPQFLLSSREKGRFLKRFFLPVFFLLPVLKGLNNKRSDVGLRLVSEQCLLSIW